MKRLYQQNNLQEQCKKYKDFAKSSTVQRLPTELSRSV